MKRRIWPRLLPVLIAALAMGALIGILGPAPTAEAQQNSAVITAMTGQVRVMAKGETTFQPARLGMRLFAGADVVAPPGSNAELRLPDGSTVVVAENTRFQVTKLDYDAQNRMRSSYFHLATGKLRAIVTKAASALVAARQSNFAITTPTAVAAVRGTTIYASFDPVTNVTTILCTDGIAIIRDMATGQMVTIRAGQATTMAPGRAPSTPAPMSPAAQQQMMAGANAATAGTSTVLNAPTVVTMSADLIEVQLQTEFAGGGQQVPILTVVTPPPAPPIVEVSK